MIEWVAEFQETIQLGGALCSNQTLAEEGSVAQICDILLIILSWRHSKRWKRDQKGSCPLLRRLDLLPSTFTPKKHPCICRGVWPSAFTPLFTPNGRRIAQPSRRVAHLGFRFSICGLRENRASAFATDGASAAVRKAKA